jgi:hypothetical protein
MTNASVSSARIRLFDCPSNFSWDEFILASPQCCVFSFSEYLASLEVEHKKLFFELNGELVASALILDPQNNNFCAPYPYSLYQGIALAPMQKKGSSGVSKRLKIITELADALSNSYPNHSLCLHPSLTDLRGFQWCNYSKPDKGIYKLLLSYTGVIRLSQFPSFDDFLYSIRAARRQDARKSQKTGCNISELADVEEFIDLYKLTFLRQGDIHQKLPLALVRRILNFVLKGHLGKALVARNIDGSAISAIVTVDDPNCTYYLLGATNPDFRHLGANTSLLLHAIQDAFLTKKKYFDMVGINSPNRGDFKTSFNAEPLPYFVAKFRR